MSPDQVKACSRKIRQYTKGYRLAMLSNDWVLRGACRLHEAIAEGRASIDRMLELGKKLSVRGTPAIFFANGSRVPGAISQQELEQRLKAQ